MNITGEKMIILTGKTASGKDSVVSELISTHGYKKIVTYTSRPQRKGERNGKEYHFISEEEFKSKIEDGFFAEWKTYNTEFGVWYYGTALSDLENASDKDVIILTPAGIKDVLGKLHKKPKVIYIYANNGTIRRRLELRGDDTAEARRRLEHDNIDFKGLEFEVDKIIYNNDGEQISEIAKKIIDYANEG